MCGGTFTFAFKPPVLLLLNLLLVCSTMCLYCFYFSLLTKEKKEEGQRGK